MKAACFKTFIQAAVKDGRLYKSFIQAADKDIRLYKSSEIYIPHESRKIF